MTDVSFLGFLQTGLDTYDHSQLSTTMYDGNVYDSMRLKFYPIDWSRNVTVRIITDKDSNDSRIDLKKYINRIGATLQVDFHGGPHCLREITFSTEESLRSLYIGNFAIYYIDDNGEEVSVPVQSKGPRGQLQQVVLEIVPQYNWPEAKASDWILIQIKNMSTGHVDRISTKLQTWKSAVSKRYKVGTDELFVKVNPDQFALVDLINEGEEEKKGEWKGGGKK